MKNRKRRRGKPGNGQGSHHEASPMGHATRTKAKVEKIRQVDRRERQKGWGA